MTFSEVFIKGIWLGIAITLAIQLAVVMAHNDDIRDARFNCIMASVERLHVHLDPGQSTYDVFAPGCAAAGDPKEGI